MGCLQVHLCWEDREPQHTVSEASGGCRQISAFRAERDMRGNEPVIYLWEALRLSLVTCCLSAVLLNSHASTSLLEFRVSVLNMFIYARRCVLARLLQCFYYIIISLFFSDVSVIYFFPAKLLLFGIREMLFFSRLTAFFWLLCGSWTADVQWIRCCLWPHYCFFCCYVQAELLLCCARDSAL